MIPLKDTIPSRTYPYVNISLIFINLGVFFYELSLGGWELARFIYNYGLIPRRFFFLSQQGFILSQYIPLFTSIFLHGGWLHIIGNTLFLWIFGDNVEDGMGHFKYLGFYLLCGIIAGFFHLYLNADSPVAAIGASGAISGVMGAYFVLFPNSRIITLFPVFFFFSLIEIPAFVFIGIWFLFQLFSGTVSLIAGGFFQGGVAWWAHIGGFISGMGLVFVFVRRKRRRRHFYI